MTESAARVRQGIREFGRWLFSDRPGVVLWLGLLCWFGLTWRIGFFIQDSYATANTLVALSNGQLHVTELRYSLTFGSQPGLYQYNGRLYGRNYGQLVAAVPLVWALEAASAVVDPRLLLAGLWSGLGLAFVTQLDVNRRWESLDVAIVGLFFAASVLTATELPRDMLALAAYQLSTIVAAATAGLVLYRLVGLLYGRRAGLAAGAALGIATPVGFWASLPKRHTLVAMLTLGTVYAFAVSRRAEGRAALRARAGAYALAGVITWIHAFEALFIVGTLGVVDLLTARSNNPRKLLVVGVVLLLAATPMLATNAAITGNPAQPPRVLPGATDDVEFSPAGEGGESEGAETGGESETPTESDAGTPAEGDTATPTDGGSTPADGDTPTPAGSDGGATTDSDSATGPGLLDDAETAAGTISRFAGGAVSNGVAALGEPERLYHVFVRSGNIPGVKYRVNNYEVIELALLEAMPLLGSLLSLPVLAGQRLVRAVRSGRRSRSVRQSLSPRSLSPTRKTDLLVVALTVVLTVVYLPRLPLFSMLTVRYLHPIVPLAAYGIIRIPAVRTGITDATGWLVRSYLLSLAAALIIVLGGITILELALGEAVQYHALWNLAAASVCAGAVLGRTVVPERISPRMVAAGLALPAGFTTAYLLLSGLVYFRYGSYAFDPVRVVVEWLPAL